MKKPLLSMAVTLLAASAALAAGDHGSHGNHVHGHGPSTKAAPEQKPWGIAGNPKKASRTIEIAMSDDMRFSPDRIEVREGETIRFALKNTGKVMHEMVIGTRKELDEHAALMAKHPGMEHDEAHMVHAEPGQRAQLVWNFNRPGEFDFACLLPGHYQAGMLGKIQVTPATSAK